ncbi:MAG: hypothetical protein ACHREM_26210 [Polyangiales bacterium]
MDLALTRGVIEKSGSYLSFGDRSLGQGREKSRDALIEDAQLALAVRQAVIALGPVKPGRARNDKSES